MVTINTKSRLSYEPETHAYYLGETLVPSVTQVLTNKKPWEGIQITTRAMDIGNHVHAYGVARLLGTSPPPSPTQYMFDDKFWVASNNLICAFYTFLTDNNKVDLISSEQIFLHEINGLKYAGRYDMVLRINNKNYLVDVKTGELKNSHALQVAAYHDAIKCSTQIDCVALLKLKQDMTYLFDTQTDDDLSNSLAAFALKLDKWYGTHAY